MTELVFLVEDSPEGATSPTRSAPRSWQRPWRASSPSPSCVLSTNKKPSDRAAGLLLL